MAAEKISARTKEKPTPVEVEYDFGEPTLEGLVAKFGKEVVFSRAKSALVIDLQALVRREIEGKEYTYDKLKAKVKDWKPSVVSGVRRSAGERLDETVSKMNPEQQAELLKKLQAQIAAAKQGAKAGAGASAAAR